jgi:hypothetical protein
MARKDLNFFLIIKELFIFVIDSLVYSPTWAETPLCTVGMVSIVPDRRRRTVPEVILVRRWVIGVPGIWRWEGLGKGLGQGRSVYKQPETEVDGSCHS